MHGWGGESEEGRRVGARPRTLRRRGPTRAGAGMSAAGEMGEEEDAMLGGIPDLSSEELKALGYSVAGADEDDDDEDGEDEDEDDEDDEDEDDEDEDADEDVEGNDDEGYEGDEVDEEDDRYIDGGGGMGTRDYDDDDDDDKRREMNLSLYPGDSDRDEGGERGGAVDVSTPRHGLQYGLGARGRGGHASGPGRSGDSDVDNGPLHLPRRLSEGLPGNLVAGLSTSTAGPLGSAGSRLPVGMPETAQRARAVKWVNSIDRNTSMEEAKALIPPLEGDPEDGEELLELVLKTVATMRGALERAAMQMYGSSPARPRPAKRARGPDDGDNDEAAASQGEETEEEDVSEESDGDGDGNGGGVDDGPDAQPRASSPSAAALPGGTRGALAQLGFALLSPRVGGQSRIPGDEEAASSSGVKLGRDYQATLVHDAELFPEMLLPDPDAEQAWSAGERMLWMRPPRFAESAVSEYVRHAVRLARSQSSGPRLGMSRGAIEERALAVLLEHDWDAAAALAALASLPDVPAHLTVSPGAGSTKGAAAAGEGGTIGEKSSAPTMSTGPTHQYHAAWTPAEELAFEGAIALVGRDFRDVAERIGGGKTPGDCASYYYNIYKRQQYRVGTKPNAWASRSMRSNGDWLSTDRKRSRAATARSNSEYGFERAEATAPLFRPKASAQAVGQALGGQQVAIAHTALAVSAAAAAGEAAARATMNSLPEEAISASTAAAMASERARQTGEHALKRGRPVVAAAPFHFVGPISQK